MKFVLAVALITVFGLVQSENIVEPLATVITTVTNIEDYKVQHPDAILTPLKQDTSPFASLKYVLGFRRAGDRLVGQSSNNHRFPQPQDVRLTLRYPQTGNGAVVTYVEILVDQSSSTGEAYVVSGGIGQTHVQIIVETKSTLYFNYRAAIYGY